MKGKELILLLILLFTSSCGKEKKCSIKSIHLIPAGLSVKLNVLKDPREIFNAGENKVIIRNSGSNLFYDLIDVNRGEVHSFGLKGRGPGEILNSHSPFYNKEANCLFSYDMMNGEYYSYDLNDIKNGKVQYNNILFSVEQNLGTPNMFIPFSDSFFVSTGTFREGRFGLYNNKGHLLYTFGKFPENEGNSKEMNGMQRAIAYGGVIASHPSKPMFVSLIRYSDQIEIYEKKSDKFVLLNHDYEPQYPPCVKLIQMGKHWSTSSCDNSIIGFQRCKVSDKYIFISFSNKNKLKLASGRHNNPRIIRVYNWSGIHVADLISDQPIWDYCVEKKGSEYFFYVITMDGEIAYKLVKYEVKL